MGLDCGLASVDSAVSKLSKVETRAIQRTEGLSPIGRANISGTGKAQAIKLSGKAGTALTAKTEVVAKGPPPQPETCPKIGMRQIHHPFW